MENTISLKQTENKEILNHQIIINNRNHIAISGISKMLSSNDTMVAMVIKNTKLTLSGKDLHIEKLDVENGTLEASGTVDTLKYNGDGVFKRIFK